MTFLITLIALIIERFFHWSHLRQWHWFTRYQYFLSVRFTHLSKPLLLLICVLPLVLMTGLVSYVMSGWLYNIPELVFGAVVLVYCLGPKNLWVQIYSCIRALNQEDPRDAIEQVKTAFGLTAVDQPQSFHQGFTRAIFIAANQRIFAVVFWFAVLGPLGAILYRAVSLCANNTSFSASELATKLRELLDWLPVRLLTFIFALGGHFTKVFSCWCQYVKHGAQSNDVMLSECGAASLYVDENEQLPENGVAEKEALALLDRVFIISLVILAAIVLV
jgi:AmpE protein